jgi:hypothetical protein
MLEGTIHRGDTVTAELGKDEDGKEKVVVKQMNEISSL